MDSSNFKFIKRFESKKLLNEVINLAIYAYFNVILKTKYVKSNMISKRENQYRDDLVEAMLKCQSECGLNYLIINSEVQEKNNVYGSLDMKIQYRHLKSINMVKEKYHTIECKRFGKNPNLNDYYHHGILDFLNGKYSMNTNFAGLICFVEQLNEYETIEILIERINNYLSKKDVSQLEKIINKNYEYVYSFNQPRNNNGEIINITHLMLDYTEIYSSN